MAQVFLKDIRWEYLSDEGKAWLDDQLGSTATGETVKESSKRRVVFFQGVYLKEVCYHGAARFLKTLGCGTACKEGRISRKLAERGVAAPEVIGYGKVVSKGLIRRDVLLTSEVPGGKSLFDFLHQDFPDLVFGEKCRFIRSFAAYIRKLHDSGLIHSDLHIANILLKEGNEFNFVLLDNDRVSLKNTISIRERIGNLAVVLSNLQPHLSRTHYLRLLKEYGFPPGEEGRAFLSALEKKMLAHWRKIWHGKARQSLTNNRRFRKEDRQGFTIYRKNENESKTLVDALLQDPDRMLEEGEIFKAGRTVLAGRIVVEGRSYFLKRYNCKGIIYQLRNAFRRSRAVRTWLASWGFRVRGIPVPEPIACIEQRHWRLLGRSYMVCEFIDPSRRLTDLWPSMEDRFHSTLSLRLGLLLGRMHLFGCVHGDLKWNNILLRQNADDWEIFLADLDGSRIHKRLPSRAAKRDVDRCLRDFDLRGGGHHRKFFLKGYGKWFPQGSQEV